MENNFTPNTTNDLENKTKPNFYNTVLEKRKKPNLLDEIENI